ncbi:MAG: hypothetical protein ACMVP2_26470 [Imperialibacter sp.]|uniref:hypothetical protein n=1 Tax=Imperialibacter sp. TaxID=2038411 RepID=UPI0032EFAFFC
MATATVRESLHHLIDSIEDEELLHAYLKIIEKALPVASDPIVGYTTKGEAITKSKLVQRAREASKRVKSGEYTSQEDLEKESENW